jgi:hypothetical protein
VASGTLPDGLSLNATSGLISGTPTTATTSGALVVVRAANTSGNGTGNITFNIAKGSQTISGVTSSISKVVGAGAYSLNASVTSNLTPSYASSNTSVATVAANGTVTVIGAGTTTLTVSQAGNTNYNAATSVTQTLTVAVAAPVVTSTTINGTVGSAVSASINATNAPTSYALASGTLPTGVSLSGTSGAITGIPTVAGNGSVTITASNGGGNGTGTITFNIAKGNQTIGGVASTMSKAVGAAAYTLNATSSARLALSYVSSNTSVATVANGTVTVLGAGVTTLTVSQVGDSNYSAAPSVTQVLTVTPAAPVVGSVTINGTVGSVLSANVSATNSPTSYAVASGTLPTGLSLNATSGVISGTPTKTTTGSSVLVVRATNTSGNGTGKITFNIAKGSQTISGVASTVSKNVGAAAYSLNASVTSNLTLSYASSNTSVATVATNGTVTVKAAGTTTLTVKQAGNANYNAASSAVQVVSVVAVATSLTVNGTVGGVLSESINATNSPTSYAVASGTLPTGLSLDEISGVISGTPTKTTTGSSVVVVRITNALGTGTGKITFNIAKGSQTISGVASTVSKNVGAAAYSLNASVTSNLTLSYASSNTSVATVAANGTVTVKAAGTTTLTVKQAGNANYNAASSAVQVVSVVAVATSLTVNGTVGGVLSESINATNSPTNYAVASGTLPTGLSLDAISGVISGTPTKTTSGSSVIVVRVTNALGTGTGKITFNIAKGSQTISGVASTVSKSVGSAAYSLNASVTSNLTLSYASSNTKVATVAANGTVTVKAAGKATLTVKQIGNTNYKAAPSVTQVLSVATGVPN